MTTVHTYPVNDLIEHCTDTNEGDCICGPRVEFVKAESDDQEDGWVIVHHSLDGREFEEAAV